MIYAVVLAAGASSRYGTSPPKQQELLPHVLAALRRAGSLDDVIVVTGAHERASILARDRAAPDDGFVPRRQRRNARLRRRRAGLMR